MLDTLPNRFINWRLIDRDGKITKVPYDYAFQRVIDANDPANWRSYAAASADGPVGFTISDQDRLVFIDVDNARGSDGQWKPEAAQLLQPFITAGAAVEISQSGRGLHVIAAVADKTAFADRRNRWQGPNGIGCEFYLTGRFCAFGPHGWQGDFNADITPLVDALVPRRETSQSDGELIASGPRPGAIGPTLTDAELITKATAAVGSAASAFGDAVTFSDLWTGNSTALARHFPSMSGAPFDHSSADASLMARLCFWTGADALRMDRLFALSALGARDKWLARPDYRRATVAHAVANCRAIYDARPTIPAVAEGGATIYNSENKITENLMASAFAEKYQGQLLFAGGFWWWWDGQIWQRDIDLLVLDLCRNFCAYVSKGDAKASSVSFVTSVLKFASADRRLVAQMSDFDRDDMLINTPTGIVNLRTGALMVHDSGYRMTKIAGTGFDPNAQCPQWLAFLNDVFDGDQGRITYLQKLVGVCLTGDIAEHLIIFAFGTGSNGKSVVLDTVRGILGVYAVETPAETLMSKRNGPSHPTELAALQGARMVFASELGENQVWDIPRLKKLTGDSTVTARFMQKDFFTFDRKFKLIIVGNHLPEIQGVDEAMRRRMRLLPFGKTIPREKRIPNLSGKLLAAEAPGILAWAVQGCLAWQREKLIEPEAVANATREYLDDENWIQRFIDDVCDVTDSRVWTPTMTIYGPYKNWVNLHGEKFEASAKRFSNALRDAGFLQFRTNQARGFYGIKLKIPIGFP